MRKLYMKFLWAYKTTSRCRSHRRRFSRVTARRRRRWSNGIGIPCVYLTGTEQTDQDIVGHAMTGYAEFSRDNAAGHASVCACKCVCVCMCVCLLVRLSLCMFVWPPASRNMRIGNYEQYRCQLPASNERRQRERGARGVRWRRRQTSGRRFGPSLVHSCWQHLALLIRPVCSQYAMLRVFPAQLLWHFRAPCPMPHALCPMPSLRSCSCSMLVMSFIALHFCRLMPLACLSVFGAAKLCTD